MNITALHTVGSLEESSGGPARSVCGLATSLANHDARVELVSNDLSTPTNDNIYPNQDLVNLFMAKPLHIFGKNRINALRFRRLLDLRINETQPDILHDHGLWLSTNFISHKLSQQYHIKHVIHPRGMLEPWAFKHKHFKKRAAMNIYQRRILQSASGICATSRQEFTNLRSIGLTPPIAIIPNGISTIDSNRSGTSPMDRRLRTALFLSRLHPKKGVVNLVKAWAIAKPAGWQLVVAGPDEGGYVSRVRQEIRVNRLEDNIHIIGNVEDRNKQHLFRDADLFILPSFSENFGMVVLEALASGLPVITTRGTPWDVLQDVHCGWWIGHGVSDLAAAISEATNLNLDDLTRMGDRGRALVEREFLWHSVGQKMIEFYRWLLGLTETPDFVMAK